MGTFGADVGAWLRIARARKLGAQVRQSIPYLPGEALRSHGGWWSAALCLGHDADGTQGRRRLLDGSELLGNRPRAGRARRADEDGSAGIVVAHRIQYSGVQY